MKKFRTQQQVCPIIVQNQTVLVLSGRRIYNSFSLNKQSSLVKHKQTEDMQHTSMTPTQPGKLSRSKPCDFLKHPTTTQRIPFTSHCTGRITVYFHQPWKFLAGKQFSHNVCQWGGSMVNLLPGKESWVRHSSIIASASRNRSRLLLGLSKRKNYTFLQCQKVNGSLVAAWCFSWSYIPVLWLTKGSLAPRGSCTQTSHSGAEQALHKALGR